MNSLQQPPSPQPAQSGQSEGEKIIVLLQFIELETRQGRIATESLAKQVTRTNSTLTGIHVVLIILLVSLFFGGFAVVIKLH